MTSPHAIPRANILITLVREQVRRDEELLAVYGEILLQSAGTTMHRIAHNWLAGIYCSAERNEKMHRIDHKTQNAAVQSEERDFASLSAGLALLSSKRVAVLAEGGARPLLPGKPILDSTHSPWNGLYLEEHRLGAVPIQEHEHRTFVLHMQMNERVEMEWHSAGHTGHQVTEAGNLIFLAPGTRDSLQFCSPSLRIVMSVDPVLIKQSSDQLGLKGIPSFENRWGYKDEQLRLLITEMTREMGTNWAMGSLYGDSLSSAFVVALIRKCGKTALPIANSKGGLSRPCLRQVLSYMNENFSHDIRLRELAQVAGLSEYHFSRSFRQSTGKTPHQYVLQTRIDRAKSLLLQPQWSILQISGAVGFRDPSHFAKVFRDMVGVGPAEWRRNS